MSHFTVMLFIPPQKVGNNPKVTLVKVVEDMLAPYQENNMGDCPEEYMEFNDQEDEILEEYNSGSIEQLVLADGTTDDPFDRKYHSAVYTAALQGDPLAMGEMAKKIQEDGEQFTYPEGSMVKEVPYRETYKTVEEFASEYHGSERDPKTGKFGYWENPSAKWDWYQIGGRWSGLLKLKPGATVGSDGFLGEPSWATDTSSIDERSVDCCQIKNLDVGHYIKETVKQAEEFWAAWEIFKKSKIDPWEKERWNGVRGDAIDVGLLKVLHSGKEPSDEERDFAVKWRDMPGTGNLSDDDPRLDNYDVFDMKTTREEFIAKALDNFNPLSTYAVLTEEGWTSPGEMGWFGMRLLYSAEENMEHKKNFMKFIENHPQDTWLVVVDCHI